MDRLWAPWRLAYVTESAARNTECIFCDARTGGRAELLLWCGQHCLVILNLYPYNNGHLMVVPNRHLSSLEALLPDEQNELMALVRLSEMALTEAYQPHGINVGINLGKAAGAGIENHLHVHLVPRWSGDTNFMTAVGGTRVVPEDLGSTAARLRPILQRLAHSATSGA